MLQLGVIGNPISHSLSPSIHHAFAEQLGLNVCYEKILLEPARFEQGVAELIDSGVSGLNVTVPFKTRAFELCAAASGPAAQAAQAANTLYLDSNGSLCADNTDGLGMINALAEDQVLIQGSNVLLLGAGGAAAGALQALMQHSPKHVVVANRTASKAHELTQRLGGAACGLTELQGHFDLVINATASSLHGQALSLPEFDCSYAMDMMYVKSGQPTEFMSTMSHRGARTADGLGMLIHQAALSFKHFTGHSPEVGSIDFSFLRTGS